MLFSTFDALPDFSGGFIDDENLCLFTCRQLTAFNSEPVARRNNLAVSLEPPINVVRQPDGALLRDILVDRLGKQSTLQSLGFIDEPAHERPSTLQCPT
jgi:hypothetical protein